MKLRVGPFVAKKNIFKDLFLVSSIIILVTLLSNITLFNFLKPSGGSLLELFISPILIYFLLATGLSVLVGKTGLIDLGYVAYFASGAYLFAIFSNKEGFNLILAVLLSLALTLILASILAFPVIRLRGDYLAIATLALGEIVSKSITNLPSLGGAIGMSAGKSFTKGTGKFNNYYFVAILLVVIIAILFSIKILDSSLLGFKLKLVRSNEHLSRDLGVDTYRIKLLAFLLSAFVGALAGILYSSKVGYLTPDNFTFNLSASILMIVVIAKSLSSTTLLLSTIFIIYIPERIRFLNGYREFTFGLILLIFVNYISSSKVPLSFIRDKLKAGKVTSKENADKKVNNSKFPVDSHILSESQPISKTLDNTTSKSLPKIEIKEYSGSHIENLVKSKRERITFKITNLELYLNKSEILKDINLKINSGKITTIVGANGAGKTSLLNLMAGNYLPSKGEVLVVGNDDKVIVSSEEVKIINPIKIIKKTKSINYKSRNAKFKKIMTKVVFKLNQSNEGYSDLSVLDNLIAGLIPVSSDEFYKLQDFICSDLKDSEIVRKFFPENDFLSQLTSPLGERSLFFRKKLAMLILFLGNKPIILLDEPFAGLNPQERAIFKEMIIYMAAEKTLIIVDHDLDTVINFTDDVVLLNNGELVFQIENFNSSKYANIFQVEDRTKWSFESITQRYEELHG